MIKCARGDTPTRSSLFNGLSDNKMLDTFNSDRYTIIKQYFKLKTNQNMAKVLFLGISLTLSIYVFLAIVCLFLFGRSVRIGTNIMDNVNTELAINPSRYESYALQILFSIVLACHIPFIFFSGKESLCIIIDEIDRRSISQTLDERIAFLTTQEKKKSMVLHRE